MEQEVKKECEKPSSTKLNQYSDTGNRCRMYIKVRNIVCTVVDAG